MKKQESKDHKLIVETLDKTNGQDAADDEKNKPKVVSKINRISLRFSYVKVIVFMILERSTFHASPGFE